MDINVNINVKIEKMEDLITSIKLLGNFDKKIIKDLDTPKTIECKEASTAEEKEQPKQIIPVEVEQPKSVIPTTTITDKYTFDQIAKAMANAMEIGKMDIINKILTTFNVQSLTAIAEEKYGDVATILREAGIKL